jgi:hypothetical protein
MTVIKSPSVTLPVDVWTEIVSVAAPITIQVGSPETVFPYHSQGVYFAISVTVPSVIDDGNLIEGPRHLASWGYPVTIGAAGERIFARPKDVGRPALIRLLNVGGGAGGGTDVFARTLAQIPTGEAGEVFPAGEERIINGNLYTNPTAANITIPATITPATLATAGLVQPLDNLSTTDYNATQTAADVTHAATIVGVIADTAANATITRIPVGLPIGAERRVLRRGANAADVYIGTGLIEIIDGSPDGGIRINATGGVVLLKKTTATVWETIEATQASGATLAQSSPLPALSITTSEITGTAVPALEKSFTTTGFSTAGDGENSAWKRLAAAPTPAKSYHRLSGDGAWWQYAPKSGEVNVTELGAVTTGLVDVGAIFVDAIELAAAIGGTLRIPNGQYLIGTTSLVVPENVSIVADGHAQLCYTGLGIALKVMGSLGTRQITRTLRLPGVMRATFGLANLPHWHTHPTALDTTSVGIMITNCGYEQVTVPAIYRFHRGLVLRAETTDPTSLTVCNTTYLGRIFNNFIGIDFDVENANNGVNQNTFIGGVVNINATAAMAGTTSVRMASAENNINTFVGTNFERGGQERALSINSVGNLFLNCRFEGGHTQAGYITFGSGSAQNKVIGNAPAVSVTLFHTMISDSGQANQLQFGNIISSKSLTIQLDGSVPIRIGNGSAVPSVPIASYGTNRLAIGDGATVGTRYHGAMWQEQRIVTVAGTTFTAGASFVTFNKTAAATIVGSTVTQADVQGMLSLMDLNGNQTLQHTATPTSGQGRMVLKAGANLLMVARQPVLFSMHDGNYYQV